MEPEIEPRGWKTPRRRGPLDQNAPSGDAGARASGFFPAGGRLLRGLLLILPLVSSLLLSADLLAAAAPDKGGRPAGASAPAEPTAGGGEEAAKPARERPLSARSMAHLHDQMRGEPPLSPADLELYLAGLPLILTLPEHPENIRDLLEATGWTENRLSYVLVKTGVGLIAILDPNDPRLDRYPLFVLPTPEERDLIRLMEPELSLAFNRDIKNSARKNRKPGKQPRGKAERSPERGRNPGGP